MQTAARREYALVTDMTVWRGASCQCNCRRGCRRDRLRENRRHSHVVACGLWFSFCTSPLSARLMRLLAVLIYKGLFSFYDVFEKTWRDPQKYLERRLTEAAYKAARYAPGRRRRRSGWHVAGRLYSNEVKNRLLYEMWMRCLG
jgi:hypothetical protein